MVHPATLLHSIGRFLIALAAAMLVPLIYGICIGDPCRPFLFAIAVTAVAGVLLLKFTAGPKNDLSHREAVLLVVLVWIACSVFGCLPFYLSPFFPSFTDAFFEAASGFTTTGATILATVEILPHSLQFWRCFTHWLGGMGIVLLAIAILPLVGVGGMSLYRAEFSGAKSEKLKPRIAETAIALWKIYFGLTLAAYLALRWAGMNPFDAVCHAFSTLGTGGFSTRTASIAAFNSVAVECIIIIFMLLAGINFTLHYRLWVEKQPRRFLADIELRFYLLVVGAATAAILSSLILHNQHSIAEALRSSLFQVCSIITTTGFVTSDFEKWSSFSQSILLALMFIGGCTGSTAGGLKTSRILLLLKVVGREFKRMVERRGVFSVRLGAKIVPEASIHSLLNLVYLAFLVNLVSCFLLTFSGVDLLTGITAVTSCMFNIGPGLGNVGPAEHYGDLPAMAKWVLSFCMLAGRLEFYTAIVIFTPAFWRR
ncbi:MAG: TrkH family potassium uptake protein [Acidobacteria bacterium]|nr:TrkH family potassium uptake protein [Acidobacteriota bacterium]